MMRQPTDRAHLVSNRGGKERLFLLGILKAALFEVVDAADTNRPSWFFANIHAAESGFHVGEPESGCTVGCEWAVS